MRTPNPVAASMHAALDGFKGPETTRAIRAAFGMIDLYPPSWAKLAWHLARHRGMYLDTKHTRAGKPVLRCTCGTLLAAPAPAARP